MLCDTQIIIWWLQDDPKLKVRTLALITDRGNEVLYSVVSLWEIALKHRLGRLEADVAAVDRHCRARGLTPLGIEVPHLVALPQMKDARHRDPFDLLLIAQAKAEGAPLLTADRVVQRYPIDIIKA